MKNKTTILVTGCAGFIGFHLSKKLLNNKNIIHGYDNLNNYYDPKLKKKRIDILQRNKNFFFKKIDITDFKKVHADFKKSKYKYVVNLAAQAGVRYSVENPRTYFDNNLLGFFNILEASRIFKIKHLLYASTSSVYGENKLFPLEETFETSKPLNFYAATKKSNEVMAYSYSNIYKLPSTGLRFFTVYGALGRPDMALFKFVDSIIKKKYLNLYNRGKHERDFTHVDDVVDAIERLIKLPPRNNIPYDIFNIASSNPIKLTKYLNIIENNLNIKAKIKLSKMQDGDIFKTHGSIKKIRKKINYNPQTTITNGIKKFIDWFKNEYR